MEEIPPEGDSFDDSPPLTETQIQRKLKKALARYELQYARGGLVSRTIGTPSRTLDDFIRKKDIPAVDQELTRALSNVEQKTSAQLRKFVVVVKKNIQKTIVTHHFGRK